MNTSAKPARSTVPRIVSTAARPNRPSPLLTMMTASTGRHNSASASTTDPNTQSDIDPSKNNRCTSSAAAPMNGSDRTHGLKDSPPYLHDGRLLTLADTVEFFNLILGTRLTADEKADLEAFLRVL